MNEAEHWLPRDVVKAMLFEAFLTGYPALLGGGPDDVLVVFHPWMP